MKEVKITPLSVLIRAGIKRPYDYDPHVVIGLKYKRRDKPTLLTREEKTFEHYWIRSILLDTPIAREALGEILELRRQIDELQAKISVLMSVTEKVDLETLHLRTIKLDEKNR